MRTLLFVAPILLLAGSFCRGADPTTPILFVTQVPMPEEVNSRTITTSYMSCVAPFGNHLGGTAFAGRGGSLWVRFGPNVIPALNHELVDLLAVADWSAVGAQPAANTVAVRNPCVHWLGTKAVFSMVIGAPADGNDNTTFVWQLFEITLPTQAQLHAGAKPVLSKVANQPPYNNIMPCYTPDDKLVFASDRPYNGQAHLLQREEYLGLPTTSGLWRLDPADAASLKLLHHSPSGAFSPMIDSAGRLIFINWDHLSRDIEAMTDERDSDTLYGEPAPGTFSGWFRTPNGSGNFADEGSGSAFAPGTAWTQGQHLDFFPEPRNADHKTLQLEWNNSINGVTTNLFMPWMLNLDGTGGEILNHVGRHEVGGGFRRSFTTDNNLVDFNPAASLGYGGLVPHNAFNNIMWIREDPLNPGAFIGADSVDLGTHGAGGIIKLGNAGAGVNPDTMTVTNLTGSVTGATRPQGIPVVKVGMNVNLVSPFTALTTPETLYRNPLPLSDGGLVASTATGIDQTDWNRGSVTAPSTPWNFRLKSLKQVSAGSQYTPDVTLTRGITITTSYWVPGQAQPVQWSGTAWELDPVEVVARSVPSIVTAGAVDPIEAAAFAASNVHLGTFQNWLTANNYALSVSRDVRFRDQHDRQQPFNIRNVWSGQQITATAGTVYNVGWVQFLEADLRRGYTLGGASPVPGRRVVATPMHTGFAENVPVSGAPAGSLKLGNDSSFAAVVPAGKALTWHLLDNDAAKTSQIKERFWVTFQPGEIRTCANCHGINTANQIGTGKPTNTPQALLDYLAFWKGNHPSGVMQHAVASASFLKNAGTASLSVTRTGGSTGPVSVDYTTSNGTALAGTHYTAVSGTLNWADGDIAPKTIAIPLLNTAVVGPPRTLGVTLSNPSYGTLGATTATTVTLTESPFQAWTFTHFGAAANTPGVGGLSDDPDGDGQDNQSEFAAGTDPASAGSVFRVRSLAVAGGGNTLAVTWDSIAGKSYRVQTATTLAPPDWSDTGGAVTAVGTSTTLTLPYDPAEFRRFYRVRLGP